MVSVLVLLLGIGLLAVVADRFVDASARLSRRLGIPMIVVGVVVIGMGTSLPEMLVSSLAAAEGRGAEALGNIVGSNVVNVSIVLGIAALITPLAVRSSVVRREAPLAVASTVTFGLAILAAGSQRFAAGIGLVVVGGLSVAGLLLTTPDDDKDELLRELEAELPDLAGEQAPVDGLSRLVGLTVVWLVALVVSSQVLLVGATGVADLIGLSPTATGILLLAFGTSLPEIASAVAAARAGEADLIMGNLMGSTLFNSTIVGGVALLAGPMPIEARWALLVPVGATLLAWAMMRRNHDITRRDGGLLFAVGLAAVVALSI